MDNIEREDMNTSESTLPDATLRHLGELRNKLLHLHKILLEMERADFERVSGRLTSGELFQLMTALRASCNKDTACAARNTTRVSMLSRELRVLLPVVQPVSQKARGSFHLPDLRNLNHPRHR